ncbi:hypothetical protein DOY81_005031 [Sarcophaga bullata]|nr:hypothetical protein DOY81_005031 [Sarcophaga bullata]
MVNNEQHVGNESSLCPHYHCHPHRHHQQGLLCLTMVLEMEMSKTYQYRKVMKPMLERKRRARINKCLDELKDIMVECLTQEGEHITRLEKADILELTVEHMKKLRAQKQLRLNGSPDAKLTIAESFRAGYIHAANEVSKTLASVPGVSVDLGTQLMSHLGHRLNYLQVIVPTAVTPLTVATAPATNTGMANSSAQHFNAMAQQQTHLSSPPSICSSPEPQLITPPPSECGSSDSGSCSPTPSEAASMWRPCFKSQIKLKMTAARRQPYSRNKSSLRWSSKTEPIRPIKS